MRLLRRLETIDTTVYYPKILRKDFTVGLNRSESGPDPDPILDIFYGCGSSLNWDGYCNPEVDKLIEQQSIEADQERRKQLVWAIERKLAEDGARPIIFYSRRGTCWQPWAKGSRSWSTASTTAIAWKTSGSTSRATSGCLSAARALSDIHPCKQSREALRSVA